MSGIKSAIDTSSFERVYKTAYSHGLEAIYTLENVDLKTIRPISFAPAIQPTKKIARQKIELSNAPQLELIFSDEYRNSIDSFILDEPIQVLGLSRHTERCLLEHGKTVLRDLASVSLHDFVFFKGMGQGHIDEIKNRLENYLEGHIVESSPLVDFNSLIRVLTCSQQQKKSHVFLIPYALSDLISLTPGESMEVRRLTDEKRQEWSQEILPELTTAKKHHYVLTALQKIVDIFFKPWMHRRMGFATRQECLERWQRIAEHPQNASKVLIFLQDLYFSGNSLFEKYFLHEKELFFVDFYTQEAYQTVIKRALTYFYKPGVCYSLQDISLNLTKEFAREWRGFTHGFIEKCLCSSSYILARKEKEGALILRLSAFANPSFRKIQASQCPH